MGEWIKKRWYVYTIEYYSAKEQNHAIYRNINGTVM
jgi:hypothetical protein